eukprot:8203128-Heterocapsa_arctica.AAC.1
MSGDGIRLCLGGAKTVFSDVHGVLVRPGRRACILSGHGVGRGRRRACILSGPRVGREALGGGFG